MTCSVVVVGCMDGNVSVMFGFLADLRIRVRLGAEASEPGAGAAPGVDLGGGG